MYHRNWEAGSERWERRFIQRDGRGGGKVKLGLEKENISVERNILKFTF